MSNACYVHGYSESEYTRMRDQSRTLAELLHFDTRYPAGAHVLEAGCGIGAQTVILARNSPEARFTCIDIAPQSIAQAQRAVTTAGFQNVEFQVADILNLPFGDESFDHVFVCFVLEHLSRPMDALLGLKRVLKPGGTITVIEGDHGSTFFYPRSERAMRTIQCLVELQARLGGNALIGRELHPLLTRAGFADVTVSPRFVYAVPSRPDWVEGFTIKTFIAMVEGVREQAIESGLIDPTTWDQGIADLWATAGPDGVFCYTFFKATARKKA
ncbi:MAG: methyltransferase domain-containing protein [Verrucomicrobiae bacterium]|nr:methyltransferase domain-containing protein [Verrucomicrobiae bacterium]